MPASGGEASEFERLKALLFSPEADRLSAAEARIRDLQAWVGDAPRLEAATTQILIEAFHRAEVARHRELAAAVAPVVVAAIRSEIHNSRDLMVEALYPITGRMVAAAVANAFRELLEAINQRLDALLSTNRWRLRLRSIVTGRSVAEIALNEARAGSFARILLLERGSGRLLAHWSPGERTVDNPDLISGLIAAISEFAATALSDKHGELRTLDLGASQVYLRASSRVILAGEMVGTIDRPHQKRLDVGFVDLVERHDRGEAIGEADLAALASPAEHASRGHGRRGAILALVALVVLAWTLSGPFKRWRQEVGIENVYARALAGDPKLAAYPLVIREDWKAETVTLTGLAGSSTERDILVAALTPAAAPLKVVPQVEIIADPAELQSAREAATREAAEIVALRARLDAIQANDEATTGALRADLAAAKLDVEHKAADLAARIEAARADDRAAATAQKAEAERRAGALQTAIDALRSPPVDPRLALARAARDAIVFFGDREDFADSAAAGRTLDALADALKRANEGVRVVGYADDTGAPAAILETSRLRAVKVAKMLADRGVAADRLVTVGRAAQSPLVDVGDARMRNRRVTFEPLFPAESP